jgi:hypothetical protein
VAPLPRRASTVKPPSSRSSLPATLGSTVASGVGAVSSSSTRSRYSRNSSTVAMRLLTSGWVLELHQVLQGLTGTIQGVGDAQPMAGPQAFGQLQAGGRRGLAGKQVVGDGAQREDVHVRAGGDVGPQGLRGQIDLAGLLDVVLDVPRAEGAQQGRPGGRLARGGLPVHHLQGRGGRLGSLDQDVLGGEGTMVEAPAMGVLEHLGQLAEHLQAQVDAEGRAPLAQEEVEPDGAGVELEDERGPKLRLLEVVDLDDAGVRDPFQDLELAQGGLLEVRACLFRGPPGKGIDADAAVDAGAEVRPIEVLPAFSLGEQALQLVVADPAGAVGGADAGLPDGLDDGPGEGTVDEDGVRAVPIPRAAGGLVRAEMIPWSSGRPGWPRPWTRARPDGSSRQVVRVADRKTSGSTQGTRARALVMAGCRRSREASRLALRLVRISGLSSVTVRPLSVQIQVWASPVKTPGRLLTSMRNSPAATGPGHPPR